jgi:hypothetical protein
MKTDLPNLLGAIIRDYFTDHLPRLRGTSPHTIHSYRDSIVLLLRFLARLLEAVGEGTKMADHLSPVFRPAFPSSAIISERSSPSRVRFAAPNNGAPLTAPGRSGKHF